jgi:hypothetical protein
MESDRKQNIKTPTNFIKGYNMSIYDIANQAEDVVDEKAGSGKWEPARAGVALMRMCSYIELGVFEAEWKGKVKQQHKVLVEFELLHPDHKIIGKDGGFKGYHKIMVRLAKSGFDKSNYMKLFSKLNYSGSVPTEEGKIPALSRFLGQPFLGQVFHNVVGDKTYCNISKDGEYHIGAAQTPLTDEVTGLPTGQFKALVVPEMNAEPRLFLWEAPGMSKTNYHQMWDTLYIEGEKDDGSSKNWIQELIISPENLELPGSVAQEIFVEGDVLPFKAEDPDVLKDLGIL